MPELIRIYWRDIPSQVIAKAGRTTAKVVLPDRFQQAIDRAAMRAGKGGSEAYMEDWRRERGPCGEALREEAERAAEALIAAFDDARLERVVKAKGLDDGAPADAPAEPSTSEAATVPVGTSVDAAAGSADGDPVR